MALNSILELNHLSSSEKKLPFAASKWPSSDDGLPDSSTIGKLKLVLGFLCDSGFLYLVSRCNVGRKKKGSDDG